MRKYLTIVCCVWLTLEKNFHLHVNVVTEGRIKRPWTYIFFTEVPEHGLDCLMDLVILVIFYILQSILSVILYIVFPLNHRRT